MKKKYYMIGNAHLDPVWMWRWQEGSAEAKATVRSALDRMKEYPDFKFVCSSASIYDWIEESAPEMFEEIKQRVREGRWIVVGGWWVQPDCNLPSGEGFARQSLYSQRYFKDKLGVTAKVGYCVDSFGHNRMLPQILRKSGMEDYIFMRPGPHENPLPYNLFLWEAPDGSRVTTCRIPDPYCFNFEDEKKLGDRLAFLASHHDDGRDTALCLYGVGNHGGGPTIRNIETTIAYRNAHPETELVFADPKEYFDGVDKASLPVHTDDLQHHASGCYAATSKIKTAIRKSETRLLAAEKYAALASKITNTQYPTERFAAAWKDVLFLHFHDIAGGCAIKSSYDDSIEFAGEAQTIAARSENRALQAISWKIDTRDREKGLPIVIFNSLSWDIETDVVINKQCAGITDENGNAVPYQYVASETHACYRRSDTMFRAKLPALGYVTYYMKDGAAEGTDKALSVSGTVLENSRLRAEFDPATGYLVSLYDKRRNCECLSAPGCVPVVIDETEHDTWSHAKNIFGNVIGQFADAEIHVKEEGPVRATLRVTSRYESSVLRIDYSLSADAEQLEARVLLDWHEKHRMLKLAFPCAVGADAQAYYEIPYGWIARPCNKEEEPGQMWTAIQDGKNGLALLNDRKYSFSADGSTLCLTAIRSPIYGDHGGPRDEDSLYTDQGENEFSFAVLPYAASVTPDFSRVTRAAETFNTRPAVILENNHEGVLANRYSGISVGSEHVIVTALKAAEDGNGYVIRLSETAGKAENAEIGIPFLNASFSAEMTPFTVKTFRIAADGTVSETLLTEYPMA